MTRYYLEIHEDGVRLPVGDPRGYEDLEEAAKEAEKKVDDALPRNTIHILLEVGYAYFRGDGEPAVKLHKNKRRIS